MQDLLDGSERRLEVLSYEDLPRLPDSALNLLADGIYALYRVEGYGPEHAFVLHTPYNDCCSPKPEPDAQECWFLDKDGDLLESPVDKSACIRDVNTTSPVLVAKKKP